MKYYFDTVDHNRPYFKNQLIKTYLSTIDFIYFINTKLSLKNKHIIDFGSGNCSNIFYIDDNFKVKSLTGVERFPQAFRHHPLLQPGTLYAPS